MRIVTRPDFDGLVCAALIFEAEKITEPVLWTEPNDMQHNLVEIRSGDIIANLPHHPAGTLWFDHHFSNRIDTPFAGLYRIAPSAAGLVYEYYRSRIGQDFKELVYQTDRVDSAALTLEEINTPEKFPYILLSMTIANNEFKDIAYWNHVVDLMRTQPMELILQDDLVNQRCRKTITQNARYQEFLYRHTKVMDKVAVTDFRGLNPPPNGNRFLVYSLFPQTVAHVKIRYSHTDRQRLILSVGHSVVNPGCNVNIGRLLSRFEGGGHEGAGACTFDARHAEHYIPEIINTLMANAPEKESA